MNFRSFVVIILNFFLLSIYAQESTETVYLKNGSIIYGRIIEEIPDVSIKIKTADGNIFMYNYSDIDKIIKINTQPPSNIINTTPQNQPVNTISIAVAPLDTFTSPKPIIAKPDYKDYYKVGFSGASAFGVLFGGSYFDEKVTYFSFQQFIGYRLSYRLLLGATLGFDLNGKGSYSVAKIPFTVDSRIYLAKKRSSPFINIGAGYAMEKINTFYEDYNNNLTLPSKYTLRSIISNLSVGYDFRIKKNLGIQINVGGRFNLYPKQYSNSTITNFNGFVRVGIAY